MNSTPSHTKLTHAGGIIGLGLFKMDWSVDYALDKFKELSHAAFSPRQLLRNSLFKNTAQLFCSYRYESEGIEWALRQAFGTGQLFGQSVDSDHLQENKEKTGVVAGMPGGRRPFLFANYSRNATGKGENDLPLS